ncbi:MAG: hypothetical protein LBB20_01250 [Puniceicoccales bacterium]|jgi:hypothetical protein|nr:hypothetical protein [Puniceicoccales bacterium]
MSDDLTVHSSSNTDRISIINDYLDAVNQETKIENPTISTVGELSIGTESLTDAPMGVNLAGLRVTDDPPSISSVGLVQHQGNEHKIDVNDDDHDGVPNYIDAKDTDNQPAVDSDKDGIPDDVDVTGSASDVKQSHRNESASAERVRSSLMSALMTFLQFDFSLLLGGADPSDNEARKIGALAQTSLGITTTKEAKVADMDNSRNVHQEMRQHKIRANLGKRRNLENEVLTDTRPLSGVTKNKFKELEKPLMASQKDLGIKSAVIQDQPIKKPPMI